MTKLLLLRIYNVECPADQFKMIEIGDGIDDYYRYLECSCFDIACRKIGDKYYDIFCDDEGLFKEDFIFSAVDPSGTGMLVGNLIFANHDDQGNTTSLSEDDVKNIIDHTCFATGDGHSLLRVICEY